jgi:ABC-type lipoprotein export system ATPase subunit
MNDENAKTPVLEFRNAEFKAAARSRTPAAKIDLVLSPGTFLIVRVRRRAESRLLADAALGLEEPARGEVLFSGRPWRSRSFSAAFSLRARIGRVFASHGWISNLDVFENVLLPCLHHTREPEKTLREKARALAKELGLSEIPAARPVSVPEETLEVLGWVRALLADPALVLLEQPEERVPSSRIPLLFEALRARKKRKTAVLWFTRDPACTGRRGIEPDGLFKASGDAPFTLENIHAETL